MEAVRNKTNALCRMLYAAFVKSSPTEACDEVQELFEALRLTKRHQLMMYQVFHELKQSEVLEVVTTAVTIKQESIYELILERRRWSEDLLKALLQLGGVEEEHVTADQFLYILLSFCGLSQVELCQALFLMILTKAESKIHHYLTMQQLIDFYSVYAKCPVTSFNTRAIDFSRLPLRRYYVEDFVELVQRFRVLLNPTIHLQRSLQEFLPSVDYWDNAQRSEVVIRKITYDFFVMEKTRCFLWGEPPFRESCDMLAPEALGFEATNKEQWDLRTFDLHERIGAVSEGGSFSKDGKLTAPSGFQYRALRQYSIWGEQPSPEATEEMMLTEQTDTYITSAGYITKSLNVAGGKEEKEEVDKNGKKIKKKKKKQAALALGQEELDPLADPASACLRGACLDETFNPPPLDMPPPWMKNCAIAPAPRILAADPPLRTNLPPGPGALTQSAFWNSQNSFMKNTGGMNDTWGESKGGATATSFGKSQLDGQRGGSKGRNPMNSSKVKFSDV